MCLAQFPKKCYIRHTYLPCRRSSTRGSWTRNSGTEKTLAFCPHCQGRMTTYTKPVANHTNRSAGTCPEASVSKRSSSGQCTLEWERWWKPSWARVAGLSMIWSTVSRACRQEGTARDNDNISLAVLINYLGIIPLRLISYIHIIEAD